MILTSKSGCEFTQVLHSSNIHSSCDRSQWIFNLQASKSAAGTPHRSNCIGQVSSFAGSFCSFGVGMQASVLSAPAAGLLMPQQLVDMPTPSLLPSVASELKGNPESTSSDEQLIEAVHAGRKNQQIRLQGKPRQEKWGLNATQTAWLAVASSFTSEVVTCSDGYT